MSEDLETKQEALSADTVVSVANKIEPKSGNSLIGTILSDRYEVLEVLGKGGMGVVYKGKRTQIDKFVAIKVLKNTLLEDEVSLKRFEQEAKASANLDDPHLISVYDFGLGPEGEPYLVMDFLVGRSLEEIIEKEGPLNLDRFMHIFKQTCMALSYIHKRGIVHRDLKPSNIMIVSTEGDNEFVKLVDFGIAKVIAEGEKLMQKLTATGQSFGSPLYMSPEQCMGKDVDARSDIYSLGCVMFEALTGKTPIAGENALQTVFMHINSPPLLLSQVGSGLSLPGAVQDILLRCLEKDPEKRFQNAVELEQSLGDLVYEQSNSELVPLNTVQNVIGPEAAVNMWISEANQQTSPINISENIVVPEFTSSIASNSSAVTMAVATNDPPKKSWKNPFVLGAMVLSCALAIYLFLPPFSGLQNFTVKMHQDSFDTKRKEVEMQFASSYSPEALKAYKDMEELARLVNASPEVSAPISIKLGLLLYRNNGDQDEAVEKLLSGIAGIEAAATDEKPAFKYPEYVEGLLELSQIYQKRNQGQEANTMLKKAYEALCNNSNCDLGVKASTVMTLAENHCKLGEKEEASKLIKANREMLKNSSDKTIRNRLKKVEKQLEVEKKQTARTERTVLDVFKALTHGKFRIKTR